MTLKIGIASTEKPRAWKCTTVLDFLFFVQLSSHQSDNTCRQQKMIERQNGTQAASSFLKHRMQRVFSNPCALPAFAEQTQRSSDCDIFKALKATGRIPSTSFPSTVAAVLGANCLSFSWGAICSNPGEFRSLCLNILSFLQILHSLQNPGKHCLGK